MKEFLRREHDIGPGEENNFRINDWAQFTDLQKTSNCNFFSFTNWHSRDQPDGWWNWCNEYYAGISDRKNKRNRPKKSIRRNSAGNLLQFIIEAVTLCIIGGIIGVIFGSSLYFLVTIFQDWVFTIPFSAILGSVLFSACVGLFFGIWPARKAAQLEPAVALRYE